MTGDIKKTLEERGTRYGAFPEHAVISQALQAVMRATPRWKELQPFQKEALMMFAHKVGRILNGDPNYADSWHDIAGYAQLVVDELNAATLPVSK